VYHPSGQTSDLLSYMIGFHIPFLDEAKVQLFFEELFPYLKKDSDLCSRKI
jgi:hypothetical protein